MITMRRQLFAVAIQASIGSRIVARESLSALRKDVTAKCECSSFGGAEGCRLRWRRDEKEEAAGEAEGRKEEDEDDR